MKKLFILLTFAGCTSASDKTAQKIKQDTPALMDTAIAPASPKVIPTDYPAMLRYIDTQLNGFKKFGKHTKDTVINEYNATITYETGHLFSKEQVHAVVNVHDASNNPVFVYKKENNKWILIHTLNEIYGAGDYPVVFRDINFDGYKDLLITWYYLAGKCNCSGEGCMNVYLYNPRTNLLVENHEIPGYLDVIIKDQEKALYLGEHCEGVYKKFHWNKMELVLEESYTRVPSECREREDVGCRIVHRVHNNGMITEDTLETDELPAKWQKIFYDND